jgi:hypothetical protein|uniref:hypothetical protein n=1 Tax=Caballeronia choica TaxID=326476 RepID=UPI000F7404B3
MGSAAPTLSASAERRFLGHAWPGNASELKNAMERLRALARSALVTEDDLAFLDASAAALAQAVALNDALPDLSLNEAVERLEWAAIKRVLAASSGNRAEATQAPHQPAVASYESILLICGPSLKKRGLPPSGALSGRGARAVSASLSSTRHAASEHANVRSESVRLRAWQLIVQRVGGAKRRKAHQTVLKRTPAGAMWCRPLRDAVVTMAS